jgi:hypothetical protein
LGPFQLRRTILKPEPDAWRRAMLFVGMIALGLAAFGMLAGFIAFCDRI